MRICFHLFYLSLNKHFFKKYFWCSVYPRQATLNSRAAQMELIFCFTKNSQRKMSKWYGLAFLVVLSFQSRPCVYKAVCTNMAIPGSQDTKYRAMTDLTAVMYCLLVTWSYPGAVLTHDLLKYQKSYFQEERNNKTLGKWI